MRLEIRRQQGALQDAAPSMTPRTAPRTPSLTAAPWHQGTRAAVIHRGRIWDYDELTARVSARAAALSEQGLRTGQVVLACDSSGPDLVVTQFALGRLNAAMCPCDPAQSPERRAALIAGAGIEWQLIEHQAAPPRLRSTGTCRESDGEPAGSLALIVETSGSQGTPKAAMLTPASIVASSTLVNRHLALGPGDRWLACLPRHHVGGLSIGYRCALAGATLVVWDGFVVDRQLYRALDTHRITHVSMVPAMLARLLSLGSPPRHLRVLLIGGQALHPSLMEQALAAGWPLHVTYGMTETFSQVATSTRLRSTPAPGVIAPPLPHIEIDAARNDEPPRRLRIRGPVVMAGYANRAREPGHGLDQGWFATSDLGRWSADGQIRVIGRADEALVIAGTQVYPQQIEARLSRAPGVTTAAVVAVPDPAWGHTLAVAYTGPVEPTVLADWCRLNLASPERPRRVERWEKLPLLASGKQDRRRIERRFLADNAED
ncbi:AMP-binding protein [Thioalkalicoccus limnaeus]|uniref:AMP-binding protein n=1 Tax=Thioalkalicoccus limnaeus TaxID=120681 RepID=A0ABV4BH34_9GAMM